MTRLALACVITAAGIAAVVTHHHKRQETQPAVSARPVTSPDRPLRTTPSAAGRSTRRAPLPVHLAPVGSDWQRWLDVTEYCATGNRNAAGLWPQVGDVAVMDRSIPFGTRVLIDGNVYIVRDWIGSGSDFDIYGGSDAGCEHRALVFGRRHLRVVVER